MRFLNFRFLSVCSIFALGLYAVGGYSSITAQAYEEVAAVPVESLKETLEKSYIDNPYLQSSRAELRSVEERLPQARAGLLPTISADLSLQGQDIRNRSATVDSDSYVSETVGVSLSQPLYRGGKTTAEMEAARHVILAQIGEVLSREQDVLLRAVTAYMNVVRDRALLDLSENNKDVISKQFDAAQVRFDVGELTKTDVEQAKARLASASAQIITARGNLRNSEAEYQNIVGVLPGVLEFPEVTVKLPESLDETILVAESSNPTVIAVRHAHQASEKDIDGVFAELLPNISLAASYTTTYDPPTASIDRQDNASISVVASIPLFQAGSVRSRVREAKHVANQRYLNISDTKRDVQQEAIRSWEALQTAVAEIDARKAQVEASAVAREGVNAETEFGARTVLDALDADQEYLDAQVALVTAQRNKIVAEFSVLAVMGELTPYVLGFGDVAHDYTPIKDAFEHDIFNMDVDRLQ